MLDDSRELTPIANVGGSAVSRSPISAGYVQDLGTRPAQVAKHAARLLDPAAT